MIHFPPVLQNIKSDYKYTLTKKYNPPFISLVVCYKTPWSETNNICFIVIYKIKMEVT